MERALRIWAGMRTIASWPFTLSSKSYVVTWYHKTNLETTGPYYTAWKLLERAITKNHAHNHLPDEQPDAGLENEPEKRFEDEA